MSKLSARHFRFDSYGMPYAERAKTQKSNLFESTFHPVATHDHTGFV